MTPAANSRTTMPWGRLRGAAPGYPAAAARRLQIPSNHEETLTNCGRSDGQLAALSGTLAFRNRCCREITYAPEFAPQITSGQRRLAGSVSNKRQDLGGLTQVFGKFSSTPT